MKICLVHDDFVQSGGAESLFATIAQIWPEAPIYTSLVDKSKVPQSIDQSRIITSWMQKIPFAKNLYKTLLPFYPLAFESFNFNDFDVVITSTTRFAKSVLTKPKTIHISYLNSTPRFLYNVEAQAEYLPSSIRFFLGPFLKWLSRWDKVSSARVDFYVANSQNVASQIDNIYGRSAEIIHPFADTNYFKVAKIHKWQLKSQDYFLIVTRLVKWKKIETAIEAADAFGSNLIIVGDGPDRKRLESISKKVQFRGRVKREELRDLYQNCRALIVTQEEDFGIAAVEAQACGKPVIAYIKGGQADIVKNGETGILFNEQNSKSIQDAISSLSSLKWSVAKNRANALRFTKSRFAGKLRETIRKYVPT